MTTEPLWAWIAFSAVVVGMLLVDLWVFHREAHAVTLKEATIWSIIWIAAALLFNLIIWLWLGGEKALQFLTGYLVEKSLSADNVFVFAVLFNYFAVPPAYRHRVLFWGVLGAIVMRLAFILLGAALLKRFHWVVYIFGAIVVVSGIKLLRGKTKHIEPQRNPVLRLARKFLPVTPDYEGQRFFVRQGGRLLATPLLLVLIAVETTDLVFAVDSVPAIFAITRDPFIVYTSNVCAILGLRALYFCLEGVIRLFRYLDQGLAIVLIFIGFKMLISEFYKIPTSISLGVVAFILAVTIALSLYQEKKEAARNRPKELPLRNPSSE
ncbi:MAG: TerC family protein [Armatimonadetes bacterium]|nr:TerC family protein [Armatimonadota bacterium]MDW8122780.1 TerC family protein [Armatimonadota bacterium]